MNNKIKEILDRLDYNEWEVDLYKVPITWCELYDIRDYITNLQQENERLTEQNNDLRKIYRHTYNWLFENGNDELARYFQAQINECRTFYVEPIIDYYKEWKDYKQRIEKAVEYIKNTTFFGLRSGKTFMSKYLNELLNILRGNDNE